MTRIFSAAETEQNDNQPNERAFPIFWGATFPAGILALFFAPAVPHGRVFGSPAERTRNKLEGVLGVSLARITMTKEDGTCRIDGPATLVAILVAARRAGDRELEREARRQLEERFRVKLRFLSELQSDREVAHAD